jgi:chromate reductase
MADKVNVITICGSLRKASFNAALARQLPKFAPEGMSITASPPWDGFPLFNADVMAAGFPAAVEALAAAIRAADGIIIVSPEYNWSIPGGLKNAIDWLSRLKEQPFKDKPVTLQSCAPGALGGARMQMHMRQSLGFVDVVMFIKPEIYVSFAAKKFDEKTLELTDQPTIDIVKQQLASFEKFVRKVSGKN